MADRGVAIALVRPDLLGTYGDGGNALVLQQRLVRRGIPAEIVVVGPGEPVPSLCDVCILGGGEDGAQVALAGDLALRDSLRRAVERDVAILAVCAAFQVLGHSFVTGDGVTRAGYGLVDCWTHRLLEPRAVGEIVVARAAAGDAGSLLTGFENHRGATSLGPGAQPLGRVLRGIGNGDGTGTEGARQGRIIATYLHGPVLARNPSIADELLGSVVGPLGELDVAAVEGLRQERLLQVSDPGGPRIRRPRRRARSRWRSRG